MTNIPEHITDVIAAIALVPRFNHDRFDMHRINHSCGTPSCAAGNLLALNNNLMGQLNRSLGNNGTAQWGELFGGSLRKTIKTPEQWGDHARAWVREQGYGHLLDTPSDEQFAKFMAKVQEPVEGEISSRVSTGNLQGEKQC